MNWDTIKGKWKQLKGEAKKKWGMLTDDDLTLIAGERDLLLGKLEERYGYAKDRAIEQVDEWIAGIEASPPPKARADERRPH